MIRHFAGVAPDVMDRFYAEIKKHHLVSDESISSSALVIKAIAYNCP
jgi:hypothetical protein